MRDPYERILSFNQNRDPHFIQFKYNSMATSAFRFFRGSCHLFYEDLAQQQSWKDNTISWICGDLHLANFGTYRSRHQVVYFDLNDFDEAVLAHPTWEVARFICSIFLAGWELQIEDDDLKTIAMHLLGQYISALQNGKAFSIEKETVKGILKKYIKTVSERDYVKFIDSKTTFNDLKQKRLKIDGKKYFAIEDDHLRTKLTFKLGEYLNHLVPKQKLRFQILDVAIRVAGTGSIGLKRYVFLVYDVVNKTYHLTDMKQASPSSLTQMSSLKVKQPAWSDEAERIQFVQNIMEYETPEWFASIIFQDQAYIVKELQPDQDKMDFKQCKASPKKFTEACNHMARLMAYAQIRSSGRKGAGSVEELIQFANEQDNHWKVELLNYSYIYAKQVVKDYQSFVQSYQA